MADTPTRPIETLRVHATALEAVLAVCLGDPKPRPVHKLRTETRRIEAQLLLLEQMHGLPAFRKQARKVRRHLKKLRRAAGRVRDIDVQRKLLDAEEQDDIKRDAKALSKLHKELRQEASDELLQQLQKHQIKLAVSLEALLATLEPAAHVELRTSDLLATVDSQFRKNRELKKLDPTTDQLHTMRKNAKVARYLAETAPSSQRAKQIAKKYESLQQAGGHWHDWMELTREARQEFGKHHTLVDHFNRRSSEHLSQFQRLLQPFRKAGSTQS